MGQDREIDAFIAGWAQTGGSELANTQSFVAGLCALIGVEAPRGSRTDDAHNDYVFERRVFQKEADGQVERVQGHAQASLGPGCRAWCQRKGLVGSRTTMPLASRSSWTVLAHHPAVEPPG